MWVASVVCTTLTSKILIHWQCIVCVVNPKVTLLLFLVLHGWWLLCKGSAVQGAKDLFLNSSTRNPCVKLLDGVSSLNQHIEEIASHFGAILNGEVSRRTSGIKDHEAFDLVAGTYFFHLLL